MGHSLERKGLRMYAVVETGGRQYRVSPGDTVDVEKLTGEVGDALTLTNVLLLGNGTEITIGTPQLVDIRVEAQIVAQKRGKKIIIFKHKRRKGYRRKQGHRQSIHTETDEVATAIHTETDEVATAIHTETEDAAVASTPEEPAAT
jgi:large subunit ribosomal protein L21